MATTKAKQTTTAKGLGWRHQQAAAALLRKHTDGRSCSWCGRPMYRDRMRNWDYNPLSTNPNSGKLHAHHSEMSRAEMIRRGLPIRPPDQLLHGRCNIQIGEGGNEHLAAGVIQTDTSKLAMPWPW